MNLGSNSKLNTHIILTSSLLTKTCDISKKLSIFIEVHTNSKPVSLFVYTRSRKRIRTRTRRSNFFWKNTWNFSLINRHMLLQEIWSFITISICYPVRIYSNITSLNTISFSSCSIWTNISLKHGTLIEVTIISKGKGRL